MTVRRYRDVAEMPAGGVSTAAPLEDRIAAAWERAHPLGHTPIVRGVVRFRTIEDAQAFRRAATIKRMRSLRAARLGPGDGKG
jgi:hypothetical protein